MSRRTKRERRERELVRVAYQGLMDNAAFRSWLFSVIEQRCCTFGASMPESGSGTVTAYREGRRSVGIELMQEAMTLAPERWVTALTDRMTVLGQAMRDEAQAQERANDAQEEKEDGL
jgi:hypothetical protein